MTILYIRMKKKESDKEKEKKIDGKLLFKHNYACIYEALF